MNNDEIIANLNLSSSMACTAKSFFRYISREIKSQGIDLPAEFCLILYKLHIYEGMSQSLIKYCLPPRDDSAISRITDSLEEKNLIVKIPDQKDKRVNLLYLTRLGKDLVPKISEIIEKAHTKASEGIQDSDMEKFRSVLIKIRKNLNE